MMYRLSQEKVNLQKKMLALALERWYSLALSREPTPSRAHHRLQKGIGGTVVSQDSSAIVLIRAEHKFTQRKSAADTSRLSESTSVANRCRKNKVFSSSTKSWL